MKKKRNTRQRQRVPSDDLESRVERALHALDSAYDLDPRGQVLVALLRDIWENYAEVRARIRRDGRIVGARAHPLTATETRLRAALVRCLALLHLDTTPQAPDVVLEGDDKQ